MKSKKKKQKKTEETRKNLYGIFIYTKDIEKKQKQKYKKKQQ